LKNVFFIRADPPLTDEFSGMADRGYESLVLPLENSVILSSFHLYFSKNRSNSVKPLTKPSKPRNTNRNLEKPSKIQSNQVKPSKTF